MDSCKEKYETDACEPFSIAIGVGLIAGTVLAILPAHVKMLSLRSADGVSPHTLLLTNIQQMLAAWNMLVLKYPQLQKCHLEEPLCQCNLLALYQTLAQWLLQVPLFYWCVHFAADSSKEHLQRTWQMQLGALLFGSALLVSWSTLSTCTWSLRLVASILGYISAFLNIFKLLPQIRTSLQHRGSGSISYPMYFAMSLGGFLNLYFQFFQSHERLSTVVSTAVGNFMYCIVLCVCVYFDCCARPRSDELIACDS
ncbi:unnamed protein product [Durusdinium trenchii]|uniref:Uncharacterized protein n=2 Tax=Durusdinium trenchii TaxID=1381693 RepID=A0ABP0RHU0_9DINO